MIHLISLDAIDWEKSDVQGNCAFFLNNIFRKRLPIVCQESHLGRNRR